MNDFSMSQDLQTRRSIPLCPLKNEMKSIIQLFQLNVHIWCFAHGIRLVGSYYFRYWNSKKCQYSSNNGLIRPFKSLEISPKPWFPHDGTPLHFIDHLAFLLEWKVSGSMAWKIWSSSLANRILGTIPTALLSMTSIEGSRVWFLCLLYLN